MASEPELGQMCFGNPTGEHGIPEHGDALIEAVLNYVESVYWNREQKRWNRCDDPKIPGLMFRSYWWGGEDAPEAALPNLQLDGDPVEIRWYKHPGRGSSCSHDLSPEEWTKWFAKAMSLVRAADIARLREMGLTIE